MNAQSRRPVRLIVVGSGGITRSMLPILQETPWLRIVGGVDVSAGALAGLEQAVPGIDTFADLDRAVAQVEADAALINTPAEWHYDQVRVTLDAGLHTLVAKPLTPSVTEAIDLVELAEQRGVTLSVGQQMRYNLHYRAVSRFVASGRLGEVESVFFQNSKPRPNPANLRGMAHPALYETSCHHFDSLLSVLGEPTPAALWCREYNPSWSPYDGGGMVNALLELDDRVDVLYHGGFCAQASMYDLRLEGTEGALRCRGRHMSARPMSYEFAPRGKDFEPAHIEEGVRSVSPWQIFLEAWHDYLTDGIEPAFSGRNNLTVLGMIDAAIRSSTTGERVRVATDSWRTVGGPTTYDTAGEHS